MVNKIQHTILIISLAVIAVIITMFQITTVHAQIVPSGTTSDIITSEAKKPTVTPTSVGISTIALSTTIMPTSILPSTDPINITTKAPTPNVTSPIKSTVPPTTTSAEVLGVSTVQSTPPVPDSTRSTLLSQSDQNLSTIIGQTPVMNSTDQGIQINRDILYELGYTNKAQNYGYLYRYSELDPEQTSNFLKISLLLAVAGLLLVELQWFYKGFRKIILNIRIPHYENAIVNE